MKQKAMNNYAKNPKNDEYYTPEIAVLPLLKYLPSAVKVVWECCDAGGSSITKVLKQRGTA